MKAPGLIRMACLCLLVAPSTHSGGLTYSVPVLPAASAKGAPSILIAYNSQSGRCYLCHKREFYKSYERRANRNAASYFNKYYGVDWKNDQFTNHYGEGRSLTGANIQWFPL